jgi:hypothetical protein
MDLMRVEGLGLDSTTGLTAALATRLLAKRPAPTAKLVTKLGSWMGRNKRGEEEHRDDTRATE